MIFLTKQSSWRIYGHYTFLYLYKHYESFNAFPNKFPFHGRPPRLLSTEVNYRKNVRFLQF